jgi:hypothetical protein
MINVYNDINIQKMEGCLYKSNDDVDMNYYLINSVATYNVVAIEFESFNSRFISKDRLFDYNEIAFSAANVKAILDNYVEFKDNIDYSWLDDYNEVVFNNKVYIIKNWINLFNFVACRF